MEAVATGRQLPPPAILSQWWQEVKDNFWDEDARPQIKQMLKGLMESTMIEELEQLRRQDQPWETALPYRNGYYQRRLVTQFGTVEDLRVPRLRHQRFQTRLFGRYQRCQHLVETLVRDMFLAGVSTRRVGAVVTALLEHKVSASTVSRITKSLNSQVQRFHRRTLVDEYQYVLLDGIRLNIRYNGTYHTRTVLVAYGITVFGQRELIDFRHAKGESQSAWEAFLNDLYHRGLRGKELKLLVMDGSPGLRAAGELVYPAAKIQRCWVHKLRNVAHSCPKKHQGCVRQARKIYLAKTRRAAYRAFDRWKAHWQPDCPKAVACLEKDLEELLNVLDCPEAHRVKVRTTNAIERSFREVRRRTRVFSCFSNLASTDRIMYAIVAHLNHAWKDRPLKDFTQFS